MYSEEEIIWSQERFGQFEPEEYHLYFKEQIQKWAGEGLFSKDAIMSRLSTDLHPRTWGSDNPELEDRVMTNFESLRNGFNTGLDRKKFITAMAQYLGANFVYLETGLSKLFDMIHWLGSFPFPPDKVEPVDYLCFLRALTILDDERALDIQGSLSGSLGPHSGMYRTERGRTIQDQRRMFFRSLATTAENADSISDGEINKSNGEVQEPDNCRTFLIPIFEIFRHDDSLERGSEEWHDSMEEVSIGRLEDERDIDLLDVLAITSTSLTAINVASPHRFTYDVVLPSVRDNQRLYLDQLHIPYNDLFDLSKILVYMNAKFECEDGEAVDAFDIDAAASGWCTKFVRPGENISWKVFNATIGQQLVFISRLISIVLD
ncbi:hypothetical protein BT63DRAFT_421296 [Microthyrium microscopicum]|uniref:Uncharacterized protein n=1 Tax=Microthyrium microscopicum TaxID=703497 RepID=A0A6A6ULE8_9PEZI|nr:hypothetical protein BT63DRAFT_421296 [Microthyrium microscopicum]